ncbi:pentatricopeptide repeat-containing protein At2g20540-like [Vigna radiata var. radiata]|uniref:Pentatricopeptide repeat-containing protein At2g20540-like n=1 Tax=Vigna radiata var. radiata TaxID=3916 RepID=A0A1S3TGL2_VIGRR|nr:pentatricopeptide repeat-containing protein At2g20540-like [Vigna radiata var. radiata]
MSSCSKRCLVLLEKCKNMKHLKQAHAQVFTTGLHTNTFALSRLLAFCSHPHQGSLIYACRLFQLIHHPTLCLYNTLIKTFLLKAKFYASLHVFTKMLQSGLCPDNYTIPYVLKACAALHSCSLGQMVHGYSSKSGLVYDIFVGNSLMAMYSVCGDVVAARYVFDEIPRLSAVSWSVMISGYAKVGDVDSARLFFDEAPEKDRGIWGAMISGYVQNSCFKEGLYLFRLLQLTEVVPDESICVSILSACAHLGALDIGIWIHRYLKRAALPLSTRLSTSLLDMYAKCGNLELAKRLFDLMPERDIVCWNAMISGMAMHGDGASALKLFSDMEKAGIKPDDITFIAVFTACSYSGMAHEGLQLLHKMCSEYKIEPKSEHYSCLVDLLSRAGLFEEAMVMIRRISSSGNVSEETLAWRAFLSACCNHGQAQLAERVAERLLRLQNHSGVYVLLSNVYSASGKHSDARRVREMMRNKRVDKVPGSSSVEIGGVVSEFIAGEETHPMTKEIHSVLEKIHLQLD